MDRRINGMGEEELLNKIKESSEYVKIPEELEPKELEKKLKSRSRKTVRLFGTLGTAAAAVLLVCCIGAVYSVNHVGRGERQEDFYDTASADMAGESGENQEESAEESENTAKTRTPKNNAGDLYQVAGDYSQVYQALAPDTDYYDTGMATGAEFVDELAEDVSSLANSYGESGEAAREEMESADTAEVAAAQKQEASYSKTNVQTKGVDESDIIKTDGNYIYTVSGNEVIITDIRERDMKAAGKITIEDDSANANVVEMYVDGDQLNVIVQQEETALQEGNAVINSPDPKYDTVEEEDMYITQGTEVMDYAKPMDKGDTTYRLVYKSVTKLLTYDISDRKNPRLLGTVTQDGFYEDSRKIGSMVYLFTQKSMEQTGVENEQVISREEAGGFIPLVNGEVIDAKCIYIPQQGNSGLVISSTDTKEPGKVVDNVLILNDYAKIYVSKQAIYLYHSDYQGSIKTRVAKFSLKNGEINAVNAASVTGEVYDTFAVSEDNGRLRILTTDWTSSEDSNNLYLFDENLNMTGKLEGIAKGEQVYAARFFGDIAYFVTYRNTDPLFAVDMSDPKNPKILSEVKLSGFSEYLHFWGEDKLVGIGYETNEDTGSQEGLKLVLFDISDPAHITIQKEFVIENGDYSPALYDYKTVLADAQENLLGFGMASYHDGKDSNSYLLFSIEEGTFKNLLTADLDQSASLEEYRGIYAGNTFYIVSPKNIISYDRNKNYSQIQKLEL